MSHRSAALRPLPLLALGTSLLLALLLALPLPAQAHDTLLTSDPVDGASLETSPEAITLTFSADVLEVSPLVRITDESGNQLAEIVPAVDGPTATATLEVPLPAGHNAFALVETGRLSADGERAGSNELVLFANDGGGSVTFRAEGDAHVVLLAGEPIDEPIVHYGPFVMNTREEVMTAMEDFRSGSFGRVPPGALQPYRP